MIALFCGCAGTGTGVQIAGFDKSSDTPSKSRKIEGNTLREKIAQIGEIKVLYAVFPVEAMYFGSDLTVIESMTDYTYITNLKLQEICTSFNGKPVKIKVITDSFTGKQSSTYAPADGHSDAWLCQNGSINFSVDNIRTKKFLQLNREVFTRHNLLLVKSNTSGEPILTNAQYNLIQTFISGNNGKIDLRSFLDSNYGLIMPRAVTKTRIIDDGSIWQQYHYQPINSVDNVEDYGALYDLNAYCAFTKGNMEPISGYSVTDMENNIFPVKGLFQCTSPEEPFYVKFKQIPDENYYNIYIKYGTLDKAVLPAQNTNTPSNSATAPAVPTVPAPSASDATSNLQHSLAQMLASKLDSASSAAFNLAAMVNSASPEAVMDTPDASVNIYWVQPAGACDQVAVVKTAKISKDRLSIENFINCAGQTKNLGNTELPTSIPDELKSREADFFRTIKSTGSLIFSDSYTGITVIGRKAQNFCRSYLFYIQGNKLIDLKTGGC